MWCHATVCLHVFHCDSVETLSRRGLVKTEDWLISDRTSQEAAPSADRCWKHSHIKCHRDNRCSISVCRSLDTRWRIWCCSCRHFHYCLHLFIIKVFGLKSESMILFSKLLCSLCLWLHASYSYSDPECVNTSCNGSINQVNGVNQSEVTRFWPCLQKTLCMCVKQDIQDWSCCYWCLVFTLNSFLDHHLWNLLQLKM